MLTLISLNRGTATDQHLNNISPKKIAYLEHQTIYHNNVSKVE